MPSAPHVTFLAPPAVTEVCVAASLFDTLAQ